MPEDFASWYSSQSHKKADIALRQIGRLKDDLHWMYIQAGTIREFEYHNAMHILCLLERSYSAIKRQNRVLSVKVSECVSSSQR